MNDKVGAQVLISGRVQGVFFRLETQRAAQRLGVLGWVRNLPDGRVAAEIEGSREAVEQMIQWCHEGSPMARVSDVAVTWQPFKGQFAGFEITG